MVNWQDYGSPFDDFTEEITQEWANSGFGKEQAKEWLNIGLKAQDYSYAEWLRDVRRVNSKWVLVCNNEESLKKEYEEEKLKKDAELIINFLAKLISEENRNKSPEKSLPQRWLDKNCPSRDREFISEIYLNEPNLEGKLDLRGFNYHDYNGDGTKVYISCSLDDSNLEIEGENIELIKLVQAQKWVNQNYPDKKSKEKIAKLDISNKNLEGDLVLSDFVNLKKLICNDNKLISLKISNCQELITVDCNNNYLNKLELINLSQLKELNCNYNKINNLAIDGCNNLEILDCSYNYLANLDFLLNSCDLEKLKQLSLGNNELAEDNLNFFSKFLNLEKLDISDNSFIGSLKPLKNLTKLKILNISNTDVDSGLEYLAYSINILICWHSKWEKKSKELEQELTSWRGSIKAWRNHWKKMWMEKGINEQEFKKWIEAGLKINEYDLAKHLKQSNYQPTDSNIEEIINNEQWRVIHSDFGYQLRKKWEEKGFNAEQTREWVRLGVKADDWKFISWLKEIKKTDIKWAKENNKEFKDLQKRYNLYGLCKECHQPNTSKLTFEWCQPCNIQYLQNDFPNWTSGNPEIDKFIQECQLKEVDRFRVLEWIPYERFTNIEYLAEGGFSKVYRAWWEGPIRNWNKEEKRWERPYGMIILKSLKNSQNITSELLQEITYHRLFDIADFIVPCYGISQDPKTKDYVIVMENGGNSLKKHLEKNLDNLDFSNGIYHLKDIARSLNSIHKKGLVHCDLHSGNILKYVGGWHGDNFTYITDLGLCQPAVFKKEEKNVYGVLPYIAPEVLQGKNYNSASDIYSFGIVAYEVLTGLPPYHDIAHDEMLALKICQGLRPNLDNIPAPQLLKDLIKRCWDADSTQRPTASELQEILWDWWVEVDRSMYEAYEEEDIEEIINQKKRKL